MKLHRLMTTTLVLSTLACTSQSKQSSVAANAPQENRSPASFGPHTTDFMVQTRKGQPLEFQYSPYDNKFYTWKGGYHVVGREYVEDLCGPGEVHFVASSAHGRADIVVNTNEQGNPSHATVQYVPESKAGHPFGTDRWDSRIFASEAVIVMAAPPQALKAQFNFEDVYPFNSKSISMKSSDGQKYSCDYKSFGCTLSESARYVRQMLAGGQHIIKYCQSYR